MVILWRRQLFGEEGFPAAHPAEKQRPPPSRLEWFQGKGVSGGFFPADGICPSVGENGILEMSENSPLQFKTEQEWNYDLAILA